MEGENKVLMSERKTEFAKRLRDLNDLIKPFNEISKAYQKLGIGNFTKEALYDAFHGNTENAKKLYVLLANEDAAGFKSKALQNIVKGEAEQFNTEYFVKVAKLHNWVNSNHLFLLDYVSVLETGEVVVTEEDKERLKENTRLYLTDPEEIEKYEIHKQILNLLNKFFGNHLPLNWLGYLHIENDKFTFPENGFNYTPLKAEPEKQQFEPQPEQFKVNPLSERYGPLKPVRGMVVNHRKNTIG